MLMWSGGFGHGSSGSIPKRRLGLGIPLLPLGSVSDDVRRGSLRIARLHNRQLFSVTGLLYRKTSHVPMPVRALIDVAHQWKSWQPRADDVLPIAG